MRAGREAAVEIAGAANHAVWAMRAERDGGVFVKNSKKAGAKKAVARKAGAKMLAGKCMCGAVHYAVADAFCYAVNCHCSLCRQATGSAFKAFAGIERDKLSITKGGQNLMLFGDEKNNDTRCKLCGSFLYSVVQEGSFAHVAMGTLVDEPTIRPTAHIFVGSKAKWFEITDGLPQYEEYEVVGKELSARLEPRAEVTPSVPPASAIRTERERR